MKVNCSEDTEEVKLVEVSVNAAGVKYAVFTTKDKYVEDVYPSGSTVFFKLKSQDKMVSFSFPIDNCDHLLILPLKYQYVVYFLQGLFDDGKQLEFEVICDE